MQIKTDRLWLRDVRPEDGPSLAEMARDGSFRDIGFDRGCGSWMAGWIAEARQLAAEDDPYAGYLAYAVTRKEEDAIIGLIGCSYYEDLRQIGVTYGIGAKYRGRGYAVEALRAYTGYFFRHYPVPRLIATVREDNVPSWRTVEKAGFWLAEKKRYQDINDEQPEWYRFYEKAR